VLQKMLTEANRQHVPVAVPNESILSMGAAISFSTVAADIATTIVGVVRQINAGYIEQVPPLTNLSEIRVVTNNDSAGKALRADPAVANEDTQSALK
jgi:ABC-type uncharacterized transport system substrate-binding protein